ncbi:hypothetical protein MKY04_09235 [Lysinibacillus telephonicus]|uniref:hypothetical protein n=1 Tax=Lysinibacillus telephonicus TaxID=1714840 RepID=UPI0031FD15FC
MKEFLKENKFLLMVMLTIFLFTPIIISLLMFVPWLRIAKGDVNGWLSFWGSYIGGLFSGLMTFLGVYLAFKLERENEKKKRARRNYKITFDLFE